jgi:hypothetical protein
MEMRKFWRQVDMLSGAIYMMESRLSTIPWKILPKDITIKRHVAIADEMMDSLTNLSDYGNGWMAMYSAFVEDLLTQDNGAFLEVIGDGEKDGPIKGRPIGLAHLDSWRCMRTSNYEFPVVYTNADGKRYRLHYTRVIFTSQMPSPMVRMYGVGFCAVSRCLNVAQNLLDIMIYKQEKLGSRPHRGVVVTKGGLDPNDLVNAFVVAESQMDNQLLRRYSKTVVVGHEDLPDAGLEMIELSGVPDGFKENESVETAMAGISLAFGVDPRELWPGLSVYATRAEALLQHIKQRGKGLGQIMAETEHQINWKFLPNTVKFSFDFQDDAQDKERAEIRNIRAQYYNITLQLGVLDARVMREQQLADGDLSPEQFNYLEALDGRLPDGIPILTLFHDPDYDDILDLGMDDPIDKRSVDEDEVLFAIDDARDNILSLLVKANAGQKKRYMLALSALDELEAYYKGEEEELVQGQELTPSVETPDEEGGSERPERPEPPKRDEADEGEPTSLDNEDLEAKGAWGAIRKAANAIRSRYTQ